MTDIRQPLPSLDQAPIAGTTYRHYKGGIYHVLHSAIAEATMEPMVVYKNAEGTLWVRTVENWNSMVMVDNKEVPRFTLMD